MIKLAGCRFQDAVGRTLVLRGVNLGGSSKVPCKPDGSTWNKKGFYNHRDVSFVGRPFPLAEAEEHFARLRAWGFTFLRFLVTWEAIEHAGPGIYDEEYLDYLRAIMQKAAECDIEVFIDSHQDVWSRFTGGDGAPGWTLGLAGFNLTRLHATGAAILHQEYGDPFPRMIWPTNSNKLAAATMFTLFFGGNDFAPQLEVDGVPIQEFLQSHYINAVRQVASRLADLPHVIGYDALNEPSNGYIGEKDLNQPASSTYIFRGETPTILQSMWMAAGHSQVVDLFDLGLTGFRKTGTKLANPQAQSAWLPGRNDIWRQHGVWDVDPTGRPVVCQPDYFCRVAGRAVDFQADYFKPFANRYARAIRAVVPDAVIFVEGVPSQGDLTWDPSDAENVVHAAHWYDDLTLFKKRYVNWMGADAEARRLVVGAGRVRRSFVQQVARIVRRSDRQMNHAPTLIGEVGIPFDMQNARAYRTGDFSMQIRALDTTMSALEENFVSFTLWNYTSDNSNARGDQWNGEDLSLFSRDQMIGSGSLDDGGRALQAAVRPYPRKVAGEPLRMRFDIRKVRFEFTFRHDPTIQAPTELFVPALQYPRGCLVEVSDGSFELDGERQLLFYHHTLGRPVHTIEITPARGSTFSLLPSR